MAIERSQTNWITGEFTTATIIAFDERVVPIDPQEFYADMGIPYPENGYVSYVWQFYLQLRLPTPFNTTPVLHLDGVTGEYRNQSFEYFMVRGDKFSEQVNPFGYNHHSKTYYGVAYDLMETTNCKHIERGLGSARLVEKPPEGRPWNAQRALLYMEPNMYVSVEMTIAWTINRNSLNDVKYYIMW